MRFGTLPNLLSLTRLALLPWAWIYLDQGALRPGFFILGIIVLTDVLDGWIARKFGHVTRLGKILDHVIDKMVILSLTGLLVRRYGFPPWFFYLLLGREALTLLAAGFLLTFRDVVGQSNGLGKAAGVAFGATIWAYLMDLEALKMPLVTLSLLLMGAASLNYLRLYLPFLRGVGVRVSLKAPNQP